MALIDSEGSRKKGNRTDKIVLGIIIFLILLVMVVIGFMIYILNTEETQVTKSVFLDDIQNETLLSKMITQYEIDYVPIKELSNIVGYEAYNGDYIYVTEEINKCHVIIKNEEVIQFKANSNEATKIKIGENVAYATLTLNNPIITLNNDLYISLKDIKNALYLYTDISNPNNIQIYSLDNLYDIYNSYVIGIGYKEIVNNYTNQKAILNDVLICRNSKDKFGAINSSGEVIIESKYDDMKYVEETGDFIVTYNGQKGIIHNQQTKVNISYDDIEYINYANLYAVTSNKKIGFFNTDGTKIVEFVYDGIGSQTKVKNARSVKYVTTKGLLVVNANGKYGLVNTQGATIVDFNLDDVYSIINNGNLEYYVVTDGNPTNLNTIVQ